MSVESWCNKRLSDLGELNRGKSKHRPRDAKHLYGGPYPFLQTGDIKSADGLVTNYSQTYSEAGLAQSRLWPRGTLAITIAANIAETAILDFDACFPDSVVGFIADKEKTSSRFVEYLFRILKRQIQHEHAGSGSVQDNINLGILNQLEFKVPPLDEQQKILSVLGVLDDKIELNRQMNETLEEMARALFRDWFIDFGPTRRQMDGATDPAAIMGHAFPNDKAAALAPLFPARLGEDGLPEGWIKGVLESIANSPRRGIHPTDVAENTPYIGLEHMPRRSIALGQWEGAGKVTSNKSVFKKGDLLFGKLRPYFHKVGRAPVDGICSTDIVVISPKSKEWDAFVSSCLSSDSFVEYTNKNSTGTRMPRTSWKIMAQYAICFPPEPIARAFQDTVEPLLEMIYSNIHETHTLAQIRDLLLPKLMSGEIQLKGAPMVQDTLDEQPIESSQLDTRKNLSLGHRM